MKLLLACRLNRNLRGICPKRPAPSRRISSGRFDQFAIINGVTIDRVITRRHTHARADTRENSRYQPSETPGIFSPIRTYTAPWPYIVAASAARFRVISVDISEKKRKKERRKDRTPRRYHRRAVPRHRLIRPIYQPPSARCRIHHPFEVHK